jgi:type I restriction-modification system DNA methylase subunit
MLKQKTYSCGICKTSPDQISHHKSHIETQKHKDKRELFELKLAKLSTNELIECYKTKEIEEIVNELETIIYNPNLLNDINKKKLKQNENENEVLNNIDLMTSVSNKEALKNKIHDIHNFLRNNGAGYGMNALKVFNLLYGLKKIEEQNLFDKVNLSNDCRFSNLLKLANENKGEVLADFIFGPLLDAISAIKTENFTLYYIIFYEIPKNIKSTVFEYLIKQIDNITKIEKKCNVLLSGKIYEYFIGRDETAISELGAYFSDRHIVDFALNKLNPVLNADGSVSTMIDMFGGSGGFTTGYIDYLNKNYSQIDWTNEINKIYHYDMNDDVIKSAGLEFFCLTGALPNLHNLECKNSFTHTFDNKKFKYILTNPPYGGDKNKKSDLQIKRDKVKKYINDERLTIKDIREDLLSVKEKELKKRIDKQLDKIDKQEKQEKKEQEKSKVSIGACSPRIQNFAIKFGLTGNDKESCSLILIMDMLEEGGTAVGILKEGVFFNKTYKDIRKCLIENFNVREIISVPQDQFENTSTKTSIVIFDNSEEKTSEVLFSDLVVEKYTEDKFEEIGEEIVLTENKGDIKENGVISISVAVASKEEILANPIYSLNGKDYNKKELVVGEGYELVKLGDICAFLSKSKRKASFGEITGKYNFYTSSDKVQKCDIADYNEECLIIGSGGVANIKIDNIFSCSADNIILKVPNNVYLYNLIKGNMNLLSDGFTGSTLKHLSKDYLTNLKIPIPKSKQKITEWVNKISEPYTKKNKNEELIMKLEEQIKNKIKNIEENEECDDVELGNILTRKNNGKTNTNDVTNTGIYPFYSATAENPSGITNKNDFDGTNYLLFAKSGGSSKTIFGNTLGIGKFWLVSGKSSGNIAIIKFEINKDFDIKYIYYYLKYKLFEIQKLALYTTGNGNIQVEDMLKTFKLKIPKNKQLIKDFDPLFQQIETLQTELKEAEELYKKLIKELSEEAMPSNKQELTKTNLLINEEKEDENEEEKTPSETSSTSSTTSIKTLHAQCKVLKINGYTKYKKKEDKEKLLKLIQQHSKE